MIEKPLFFVHLKKRGLYFLGLLLVFALFISLAIEYKEFREIKKTPIYITTAKVLNHYQKFSKRSKKRYDVLKLKSDKGFVFYTVSWKKLDVDIKDTLKVGFFTKKTEPPNGDPKGAFLAPGKFIKISLQSSQKDRLRPISKSNTKLKEGQEEIF